MENAKPKPPDRLSASPGSPYFDADVCKRVRVFLDGVERRGDVDEYCVSGGWIMRRVLNGFGRFARLETRMMRGKVEVQWK